MVRSVSGGDRPQAPKAEQAQKAHTISKPTVQAKINDSFGMPGAPVLDAKLTTLNDAGVALDQKSLETTLGTLESFAGRMTAEVKGKPMAKDVSPLASATQKSDAPPVPMTIVAKAVALQTQAKEGKIVLTEQAKEILKTLTHAASLQLDKSLRQTATLTAQQQAHVQTFTATAQQALRSQANIDRKYAARSQQTAADVAELESLEKAWSPLAGALEGGDIEAMAELIMMQCAHEHETDLKDLLAEMKSTTEKKRVLRDAMTAAKKERADVAVQIRAEYDAKVTAKEIDPTKTTYADYEKGRKVSSNLLAVADKPDGVAPKLALAAADDANAKSLDQVDQDIATMGTNMDSLGDMTQQMQIKLQLALDRRSKIFETLSAIMKKSSGTRDQIIQNMK